MLGIRTKCAFTLVELSIVVIVVGILAAIAVLNFVEVTETTREKEAITALEQIKAAEISYRYEENTYWPTPAEGAVGRIATINSQFNLDLDKTTDRNWDYSITADATTFTATATRTGETKTITINQAGTIVITEEE